MTSLAASVRIGARFAWARGLAVLATGAIFTALWVLVLAVGPTIEQRWFPVIRHFEPVAKGVTDDGSLWMIARFYKARDCQYVGITWLVGDDDPETGYRTIDSVVAGIEGGEIERRPLGWNISRTWVLGRPAYVSEGEQLEGFVLYQCGFPWVTAVPVGPYPYWGPPIEPPAVPGMSGPPSAARSGLTP